MIKPIEVCFGCGATRELDVSPQWQEVQVLGYGFSKNKHHQGHMHFCDECMQRIGPFMESNGLARLVNLNDLSAALGKKSWLEKKVGSPVMGLSLPEAAKDYSEGRRW